MRTLNRACVLLASLAIFALMTSAQTTDFTYQGSLNNGGSPANGNFDFEFQLYNALAAGTQVGSTQSINNVVVTNGVFAVKLNFSTNFPGANRFLEIRVRPSGGGAFTLLTPRTQITSEPHAINALQLAGQPASAYVTSGSPIINAASQFNLGGARFISNPGTDNTYVGVGAAENATALAENNSFFGKNAGQSMTTAGGNSFFGSAAGQATTTGGANTFVGSQTGKANTTGSSNSFYGLNAGTSNTTGNNNSFFGRNAGSSNTTGGDNSFFGFQAGLSSNNNNNSFFGFQSGRDTTGINNSFFGWSSGRSNTTGTNNSFFGVQAGLNNDVGIRNVFVGRDAGLTNTSGNNNVAVGFNAGLNTLTGNNNVYLGSGAGLANNLGSNNTVLGANANTGGPNNFATAVGAGAVVTTDNTVVLGRSSDTVKVPGDAAVAGNADVAGELTVSGFTNASIVKATQFWQSNFQSPGGSVLCYFLNAPGFAVFTNCASSIRYKKDVEDYKHGMSIVSRLRPVSFTWKRDGLHDLGFIAEEVAEIDPLLATYNREGIVEGVKYDRIGAVLVNAVKEQQAEITMQGKKLETQEREIDHLSGQVEILKKLVCSANPQADVCKPID